MISYVIAGALFVAFYYVGKYLYLTFFDKQKKKLWLTEKDRYKLFTEEQVEYLEYLQKLKENGFGIISKLNKNDEEQLENYSNFYKGVITYEQFLERLYLYKGRTGFCLFCSKEVILDNSEIKNKSFICPECRKLNQF